MTLFQMETRQGQLVQINLGPEKPRRNIITLVRRTPDPTLG